VIPLQDVIPTSRKPVVTLTLIALNALMVAAPLATNLAAPFKHANVSTLMFGMLFLWLFGDNVEARLGRLALLLVYLLAGWLCGIGAVGAITAVLGSYFVLLPRSRVLMLVPAPSILVEVPASFFLAMWAALQMLQFVVRPRTILAFALALAIGAAAALVLRRPIKW
jgi:membrane associated rhomboid family serine protease